MLGFKEEPIPVRLLVPLDEGPLDWPDRRPGLRGEDAGEILRETEGLIGRRQMVHDPKAEGVESFQRLPGDEDFEGVGAAYDPREARRAAMARHPAHVDLGVREDRRLRRHPDVTGEGRALPR